MKNEEILHHTAARLQDREYICRIVRPGVAAPAKVSYTHRDDYYISGIIVNGEIDCVIDFQNYSFAKRAEVCCVLGEYYETKEDAQEAAMWYLNARSEAECILDVRCGGEIPEKRLQALGF